MSVCGLEPDSKYTLQMEMCPASSDRYKYVNSEWLSVGKGDSHDPSQMVHVHPDSPANGKQWMRDKVHFKKVKLTNDKNTRKAYVCLPRHVVFYMLYGVICAICGHARVYLALKRCLCHVCWCTCVMCAGGPVSCVLVYLCHVCWWACVMCAGGLVSCVLVGLCHVCWCTCVMCAGGPASCVLVDLCHVCWWACVMCAGGPVSCVLVGLRHVCWWTCVMCAGVLVSCVLVYLLVDLCHWLYHDHTCLPSGCPQLHAQVPTQDPYSETSEQEGNNSCLLY